MRKTFAIRGVRCLGGKPAKTGGDVTAAAKERPEEAPFAALRPHDYRLRTWSRRPAAKPTHPKNHHHYHQKKRGCLFGKHPLRKTECE